MAEKTFEGAEATQEDAPVSLWLDSPYQISKIIGEYYANYYFSRHGLPIVKARFQNVYGPGEVLGAGRWRGTVNTVWRNVTPTFVYKALKHEALPVENGGIASRDFIYVGDMAQGLIACALRGEPGGVYNLASGVETTIRELAELINELTGNPTPIALTPGARLGPLGPALRRPRTSRARELGFEATTQLREGLERTIAWTRENLEWIERCIARHAERMPDRPRRRPVILCPDCGNELHDVGTSDCALRVAAARARRRCARAAGQCGSRQPHLCRLQRALRASGRRTTRAVDPARGSPPSEIGAAAGGARRRARAGRLRRGDGTRALLDLLQRSARHRSWASSWPGPTWASRPGGGVGSRRRR